jgi:hypothetical protein
MARVRARADVWRTLTKGLAIATVVAAAALPLWMIQKIIEPLAGKSTLVRADVPLKIGIAISLGFNLLQVIQGSVRKRTIKRQREQLDKAEIEFGVKIE